MAGGRLAIVSMMALCVGLLLTGCRENPCQKAYRQGVQALKRGHYSKSIRLLQESVNRGGTNAPVASIYNCQGLAYYRVGQHESALGAFDRSARLDPKFAEPLYNIGVILAESGRDAQAVTYFERAARLDLSDTRALEYQSRLFYRNQRWDDARRTLNEAYQRAPREPRILTALALHELHTENVMRSISFLQEALDHDAGYAPAIYNLAMINYSRLKNDNQAAQLFKDYLHLAPKGEGAEKAVQALREINKSSAAAVEQASNAPPAAAAVQFGPSPDGPSIPPVPKAVTEQPSSPAVMPSCEELIRVARTLERQGRREAAVNNYLRAAREAQRVGRPSIRDQAAREANGLCAQNASAHYEMGKYWAECGQSDEALIHLKQATEFSNSWYEANMALARVATDKAEFDTAVVALKQADQTGADRPEALWLLAQMYDRNLSLTNQAIDAYERFEKRYANDARAQEGQARLQALKSGNAQDVESIASGQTETQARWQWLFKSRATPPPGK